ncbi:MAG TPA: TolC family protein [Candidatus Dormibacteraeota bacterium]|nr:TolC family protein [Candidatus Dormibacteraeota bacterium]
MVFTRPRTLGRAALFVPLLSFVSCYHYRPQPLLPPAVEQQYRSRSLADPGLKEFIEAQPVGKPASWPSTELNLDTLTLIAFYFHPDLDAARARFATSEAGVITASKKPNPGGSGAGGYTNAERAAYVLKFSLDWTIETAGKPEYRTQQARNLSEAARFSLGETAWQVRSRVRAALLDHLLASRELELLMREQQTRAEALKLYEERLSAGEISRPEVDVVRTSLTLLDVTTERAKGREKETQAALEASLGLAPAALNGVRFVWNSFETPPGEETLPLLNVQRAGLLNRLDVQRLLAEYAASENALQLEAARQYPDIRISPGYEFTEGFNSYFIGPSALLPLRDRNQGPIAEAEARRAETAARFLAQQAAAIDQIERALIRYRAALADFREADSRLKVLLEDRERAIQQQIQAGEADQLALVGVRLEAVAAAGARLNALRAAQTDLGAVEDAVQYPLESGIALPPVPEANPRRTQ